VRVVDVAAQRDHVHDREYARAPPAVLLDCRIVDQAHDRAVTGLLPGGRMRGDHRVRLAAEQHLAQRAVGHRGDRDVGRRVERDALDPPPGSLTPPWCQRTPRMSTPCSWASRPRT
jgi:hypothetical protein